MAHVEGLIFDLDHCLFDTGSMTGHVIDPVLAVFRRHFFGDLLASCERDLWTQPLSAIVKNHNISKDIARELYTAYAGLRAPAHSKLYDDIDVLRELPQRKVLVTTGFQKFQQSKIVVTGLAAYFSDIRIDAIDDQSSVKGKLRIFKEILHDYAWRSEHVMAIGDNPNSELAAGKTLGMITVQTLRPTIKKGEGFTHYISTLHELKQLLA